MVRLACHADDCSRQGDLCVRSRRQSEVGQVCQGLDPGPSVQASTATDDVSSYFSRGYDSKVSGQRRLATMTKLNYAERISSAEQRSA